MIWLDSYKIKPLKLEISMFKHNALKTKKLMFIQLKNRILYSFSFLGNTFKDVLDVEWNKEISTKKYDVHVCENSV